MKISERVKNLTTSPIRRLAPYAAAAKKAGKKVYHLNIGQPDIVTPPNFLEAIRNYKAPVIAYSNSKGEDFLVEAIRRYYLQWGMDYPAEGIYVTNGGSEALQFAVMGLCDPGDEIIVFEPFYANYNTFAKQVNACLKPVATSPESGYRLPAEATIEAAIGPKTRGILLTNPGNPTGVVYTDEELETIARIVKKHDIALISDEVYREFVYDGAYRSFGTFPELEQNLIIIDSVSKRYSACGARVGCLITKNLELTKNIMKLCQARLCSPILEQVGAAALYETPASYLEEVNAEYKKRRDTIAAALQAIPGVVSSNPKGAFYVMVKLPVDSAEKFAIWLLEEFSDNGETVMFAPGNGFYAGSGRGEDEARLAYVLNCQDLTRAMEILAKGLKAYPGYTLK